MPTQVRPIWEAEGVEKRQEVRNMFAQIAPIYDRVNGWMTLRLHRKWRNNAVRTLNLKPGDAAADICAGTGDFLMPLRSATGSSGRLIAIDFCRPMLELAGSKDGLAVPGVGDACRLPLTSGAFQGVTVGWGLRNVADLQGAINELFRITSRGGRLVALDCAVPKNPVVRAGSRFVTNKLGPVIGAILGAREAYTYLPESTERFATPTRVAELMRNSGFEQIEFKTFFFGNVFQICGVKP